MGFFDNYDSEGNYIPTPIRSYDKNGQYIDSINYKFNPDFMPLSTNDDIMPTLALMEQREKRQRDFEIDLHKPLVKTDFKALETSAQDFCSKLPPIRGLDSIKIEAKPKFNINNNGWKV